MRSVVCILDQEAMLLVNLGDFPEEAIRVQVETAWKAEHGGELPRLVDWHITREEVEDEDQVLRTRLVLTVTEHPETPEQIEARAAAEAAAWGPR